MRRLAPALLLLALACLPARADDVSLVQSIQTTFIVPRVDALAKAATDNDAAWRSVCPAPNAAGVERLKASFGALAEAWAAIEIIRDGPIAEESRFERMAFWPEKKNAVTRGIAKLLAGDDPKDLAPDRFRKLSVAVQGLTALEKVLFGGPIDPTPAGARRCATGAAIAGALAATTTEIQEGWKSDPDTKAEDADKARLALGRLTTDLLTLQDIIVARKLGDVLGKSAAEAKPAKAEMALAGRSLRQIAANLESATALAKLLVGDRGEDGANVVAASETAAAIAGRFKEPLDTLVADQKGRVRLGLLSDAVKAAEDLSRDVIPAKLGISIGFNSLDGD